LYVGDEELPKTPPRIDSHNEYFLEQKNDKLLKKSIDELVRDPNNYFCYDGVKMLDLSLLRKVKHYRSEPKDIIDVDSIDEFLGKIEENNSKAILNPIDKDWYSNIEALYKEYEGKMPKVYFNAKLLVPTGTRQVLKKWQESIKSYTYGFNADDYFYNFELFQELGLKWEKVFLRQVTTTLKYYVHNEETVIMHRILFTAFVKDNPRAKSEKLESLLLKFIKENPL
jgi:hypothetical protein